MSETASAPVSSGASESTGSSESVGNPSETGSEQVAGGENREQTVSKTEPQAQSMKKKLKLKVDGEEFEEEIDFADEEGLARKLRMAKAAENRIAKAKTATAKAMELIQAIENGDEEFFEKLGPKGQAAAEKFLLKKIHEQMETPEQKQARIEKEELERFRNQDKLSKEQAEKRALEEKSYKYAQDYQNTIIGALEKAGLPKSPEAVKRMAGLLNKNLDLGLDLTADELASEYRNEVLGIMKSITGSADGDQLIALFGDEIANKIRKSDLKKLQEKHSQLFQSKPSTQTVSSQGRPDRPLTMDEWKEQLDKKFS